MKQVSRPNSKTIVHIMSLGEVVMLHTCSTSQQLEIGLPRLRLSTMFWLQSKTLGVAAVPQNHIILLVVTVSGIC